MNRAILATLAVAAMISPSVAAAAVGQAVPPGFEGVFTGALVSTYPDGRIGKVWVSPDGSFVGLGRHGGRNGGRWTLSEGHVCMRQTRPIPLLFRYCTPLPPSLTVPWPAKAPTGEPVTLRFVRGDRP